MPSFEYFLRQIRLSVADLFSQGLDVPGFMAILRKWMETFGFGEFYPEKELKRFFQETGLSKGGMAVSELEKEMIELWGPSNGFSKWLEPAVNDQAKKKEEAGGKRGKKKSKKKGKNGK